MDQLVVGVSGLPGLRTIVTPTEIDITAYRSHSDRHKNRQPKQVDPSTVCVTDANSAFDHLVRESTGGHCRRTAQDLCVIRRNMQTLRVRCRWVPHERMVVDALTKRHGNKVTMVRLLPDGVLSIVDEDHELATRKKTGKRTNEIHSHINKLSIRKLGNTIDEILWVVLMRSKTMRRLETILGQSLFLVDEARCASALFVGHVVYLCLSSSSDDHRSLHSCLGTGTRVETQKQVLVFFRSSLVHPVSLIALCCVGV